MKYVATLWLLSICLCEDYKFDTIGTLDEHSQLKKLLEWSISNSDPNLIHSNMINSLKPDCDESCQETLFGSKKPSLDWKTLQEDPSFIISNPQEVEEMITDLEISIYSNHPPSPHAIPYLFLTQMAEASKFAYNIQTSSSRLLSSFFEEDYSSLFLPSLLTPYKKKTIAHTLLHKILFDIQNALSLFNTIDYLPSSLSFSYTTETESLLLKRVLFDSSTKEEISRELLQWQYDLSLTQLSLLSNLLRVLVNNTLTTLVESDDINTAHTSSLPYDVLTEGNFLLMDIYRTMKRMSTLLTTCKRPHLSIYLPIHLQINVQDQLNVFASKANTVIYRYNKLKESLREEFSDEYLMKSFDLLSSFLQIGLREGDKMNLTLVENTLKNGEFLLTKVRGESREREIIAIFKRNASLTINRCLQAFHNEKGGNLTLEDVCGKLLSLDKVMEIDIHYGEDNVNGPSKRAAHVAATIGDYLAIFGGWGGSSPLNDVYFFDMKERKWFATECVYGNPPSPRNNHAGDSCGSRLYIHGGHTGEEWLGDLHYLETCLKSEPTSELSFTPNGKIKIAWLSIPNNSLAPSPRACHTLTFSGSNFVMFGGFDGNICYNDVWAFDIKNRLWNELKTRNNPVPKNAHTAICLNSKLYVFGGHSNDYLMNDMHCLNLTTLEWSLVNVRGSIPKGVRGHSMCCLDDNHIFVYGGFDGYDRLNKSYIFDVNTGVWKLFQGKNNQQILPRQRHTCNVYYCLEKSTIETFIFGGFNGMDWYDDLTSIVFGGSKIEKQGHEEKMAEVIGEVNSLNGLSSEAYGAGGGVPFNPTAMNFKTPTTQTATSVAPVSATSVTPVTASGATTAHSVGNGPAIHGSMHSNPGVHNSLQNNVPHSTPQSHAGALPSAQSPTLVNGDLNSNLSNNAVTFAPPPSNAGHISSSTTTATNQTPQDLLIKQIESESKEIILSNYQKLLSDPLFADVILSIEDKELYCHRNILSVQSYHFNMLFANPQYETNNEHILHIKLSGASYNSYLSLITYLYTGVVQNFGNNIKEIGELLNLAKQFDVKNLMNLCERELLKKIDQNNCWHIFKIADKTGTAVLRRETVDYIINNLHQVVKTDGFHSMNDSAELLMEITRIMGEKSTATQRANSFPSQNQAFPYQQAQNPTTQQGQAQPYQAQQTQPYPAQHGQSYQAQGQSQQVSQHMQGSQGVVGNHVAQGENHHFYIHQKQHQPHMYPNNLVVNNHNVI